MSPSTATIPPIISVGRPPGRTSRRVDQPAPVAAYHERCPHVVYAPMGDEPILDGAMYIESARDDGQGGGVVGLRGPLVLHQAGHRRGRATRPTRSSLTGVTYEEMRRGCWDPRGAPRRHDGQPHRGVAVLPELPALRRADLHARPRTRIWPCSASRPTTTSWWTSGAPGSGGRLIPLCLIPLWDVDLAVGRAPAQRRAWRAGRRVHRVPGLARPAEHPLGVLGPVLRGVRGDRHGRLHAHRVGDPDDAHRHRTRPTRCRPPTSSPTARRP